VSPARKSKRFVLFLPISYPNADDLKRARAAGRPAGSGVGIHGPQGWYAFLGQAQALANHSDGCIVLDEPGIRELAAHITRPVALEILAELPR
jgi:murein L,D-transpeptidase YafK